MAKISLPRHTTIVRHVTLTAVLLVVSVAGAEGQMLDEKFLNSTVLITFRTSSTTVSAGTGFLIFKQLRPNEGHVFLVTNKHVIPREGKQLDISIRVNTKSTQVPQVKLIQIPLVGTDGKYVPSVRLHKDPGHDVAAIDITEQVVKEKIEAAWIPYDLLVTNERLINEKITAGDEIFLLGYPDAIFDPRNVSPVLRKGVISTVPVQGYSFNAALKAKFGLPDHIDGFLIDAAVFPGSSGSLVVLKPQPTTIGPGGATVVSNQKKIPYVLGIVSKSIPITDAALGSTQRMGLGVVYGANAIRETIEQFYPK